MASLTLHILLRTNSRERYTLIGSIDFENDAGEIIEGTWRQEVISTNVAGLHLQHLVEHALLLKKLEMNSSYILMGQVKFPFNGEYEAIKTLRKHMRKTYFES